MYQRREETHCWLRGFILLRNTHTHTLADMQKGCTKDTRWLSVCGLFNRNYVGEHKTSLRRSKQRDYITVAHINMQTLIEGQCTHTHTHARTGIHTLLPIHGLVILISIKNVLKLWDGRSAHQDELTHTSTERLCVRSHTGFIMLETCEGGQEPFLSPVLSIHAGRGTRSLPSGCYKRPALLYCTHQQQAGADTHTPAWDQTLYKPTNIQRTWLFYVL